MHFKFSRTYILLALIETYDAKLNTKLNYKSSTTKLRVLKITYAITDSHGLYSHFTHSLYEKLQFCIQVNINTYVAFESVEVF